MTWKVHWEDVILPCKKKRGSMPSLNANKYGSQTVNMREGDCNSPVKSLREANLILCFTRENDNSIISEF